MKKIYENGNWPCQALKKILLVMKITSVIILISIMHVSATVYSQSTKLSLNMQEATIKEVLQKIESLSEFRFIYQNEQVDLSKKVDAKFKEKNVEAILNRIFEDEKIEYSISENKLILIKPLGSNPNAPNRFHYGVFQQKPVSGKITDPKGQSLPGVTVIVKGTTKGTVTDANGNYSLTNVPENATLQFSFVGMTTQEIAVAGKTLIDVTMEDSTVGVEEVVVIGYGTQKKINLTGAVSTVSSKELADRSVSTVAEALQGMVPNLQISTTDGGRPGSDLNWQIRGVGTIGASGDPLILIDGIPGGASNLNPDDIESISVLKDAAASAIYGSRAPYGVVIITTKKGKSEQMKVTFNSSLSWRMPTDSELFHPMGSMELVDYYNESSDNAGLAHFFSQEWIDYIQYNVEHPGERPDMSIDPNNPASYYYSGAVDVNWWKEAYKSSALTQNYNINASGGTKAVTYYASLGYFNEDGLYRHGDDYYHRYTGLLKLHAEATKWLELDFKIQLARRDKNRPNDKGNIQYNALRTWAIYPIMKPNGTWMSQARGFHIGDEGGRISDITDVFNNTLSFVIKPLKDLRINGDFTFDSGNQLYTANTKILYTYNALSEVNGTQSGAGTSDITKNYGVNKYYTTNVYADYDKQINAHNLHLLLGYQQEYNHYYQLKSYRNNLISDDILSLNVATGSNIQATDSESEWATGVSLADSIIIIKRSTCLR